MRTMMAALAATGLMLAATQTLAETAAATQAAKAPAASNANDAARTRRLDLAHRYFAAVNVDSMTRKLMDNMLPAMLAQQQKEMTAVAPDVRDALVSSIQESMGAIFPRMMDRMAELYADNFTEVELQKLVSFYESPDGRQITAKNSQVVAQSGPLMAQMMSEMRGDFMKRFCGKIDCNKAKAPLPNKS